MAYMDFSLDALFGIEDKVIVVTGGTGLIGRDMAAAMLRFGAKVALLDDDAELVAKTVAELKKEYKDGVIAGYAADITKPAAVNRVFAKIVKDFGPLYGLLNMKEVRYESYVSQMDPAVWQNVMDVNVRGTFLCMKAFAEFRGQKGRGRIINLSSICSTHGRPRLTAFTTAKAAIDGLTFSIAAEWMYRGITVNAIAPEYKVFATGDKSDEALLEAKESIQGVYCSPEKFTELAVYLLSANSDYISGEVIGADGGTTHGDIHAYKPENWPEEDI